MTVSQAAEPEQIKPAKSGALHELLEIVKTIAWALGIALVLRVLLFQPFTIPSPSMEPSLYQGDYIIVSKWTYGYSRHSIPFSPPLFEGRLFGRAPERGDVVVFKLPSDGHTDYIKRVIGLPGDRVQVRGDEVTVNGQPFSYAPVAAPNGERTNCYNHVTDEMPYTPPPSSLGFHRETLPGGLSHVTQDCFPAEARASDPRLLDEDGSLRTYIVPAGHFFLMGDNRDDSLDSRFASEAGGVGFVPAENVVGKAELILLSWSHDAAFFKPWTWVTELRPSRFFKRLR